MIPEFDVNGNLPRGTHWATWQEFLERFGTNPHRLRLLGGFSRAKDILSLVGCKVIYVDGSFVTSKDMPNDFDACWDTEGVDIALLMLTEPVFLENKNRRAAQKLIFYGEFFQINKLDQSFLNFFQSDKNGNPKGIVALGLGN